jgi:hypothetical protein
VAVDIYVIYNITCDALWSVRQICKLQNHFLTFQDKIINDVFF